MPEIPDYFNEYVLDQQVADPDNTYYNWSDDPIILAGDESRPDLELQGDYRVPRSSFPKKIFDALTSTPQSFLVTALIILAVIFALRA